MGCRCVFILLLLLVPVTFSDKAKDKGKKANKKEKTKICKAGAIIYSYGESDIDIVARSLKASTQYTFCGHLEAFGPTRRQSSIPNLQHCRDAVDCPLMHIKPYHIEGRNVMDVQLKNSSMFFGAAVIVGFTKMITTYRHNILARYIDNIEAQHDKAKPNITSTSWNFTNFDEKIIASAASYNKGYAAAMEAGIYPLYFSHGDFSKKQCNFLRNMAEYLETKFSCHVSVPKLGATSASQNTATTGATAVTAAPVAKRKPAPPGAKPKPAPPPLSLKDRIGEANAKIVTESLKKTPYKWMLDLRKVKWPHNVRWPVAAMPLPERFQRGVELGPGFRRLKKRKEEDILLLK